MKVLGVISVATLVLLIALAGLAPFGRLALALDMPRLAARCFEDPGWRGVALYRAGDYDQAAKAFREARDFYNLGNAETQAGRYAAALEAYDLAIALGHPAAQTNFDTVAAYYAGLQIDPEALALFQKREEGASMAAELGQGDGRAAGTGDEVTNTNTMLGLVELDSRGRLGVRQVFDDAFMVADERWLQQLSDVPGDYLQARIRHEHKRRQKLGLSPEAGQ